ncbi:hypothetical protein [Sphingobacterium sp. LRF_L2]|uniref:hypothetical protein n=1 Tax=Sphingobacterium sp. LRF_L2 TaxID=3369421 RepID=UPI003F5F1C75
MVSIEKNLFGFLGVKLLFVIVLSTLIHTGRAQQLDQLLLDAEVVQKKQVQEKLYLHLDKPLYTVGETIWFKVYCAVGIENLLSNWSKIVYVELIDPKERRLARLKIPLVYGLGIGDITLQDTLIEGSYRLRAYSNWMRNDDEQFFYDRTLQISNGRSDQVKTITSRKVEGSNQRYQVELRGFNGITLPNTDVDITFAQPNKKLQRKKLQTDEWGKFSFLLDTTDTESVISYSFTSREGRMLTKVLKREQHENRRLVEVFPEGGKLVMGQMNHVGIKACTGQGLGIKTKVIFFAGDDSLATAESNSLGMGATSFYLDPTRKLRAIAEFEDGTQQQVDLPESRQSGYTLHVDESKNTGVWAHLHLSKDLVNHETIYFVVHHAGKVYARTQALADRNTLDFFAETDTLPNGVLTLTVFNARLIPIVERPFFHYDPKREAPLKIQVDKDTFSTREKVTVHLRLEQPEGKGLAAAISASVVQLDKIDHSLLTNAATIQSTLLLHSDVKGFIENPGFYFSNDSIKKTDLAYLMLTQGWRNIDWLTIDTNRHLKYKKEEGLTISGYTKKLGRSTPEIGATVRLFPKINLSNYKQTISNKDGYFIFDDLLFWDKRGYILSAKDAKGKNRIDIILEEQEVPAFGPNRNKAMEINDVNTLFQTDVQEAQLYFAQMERVGAMDGAIWIDPVVVERRANKAAPNSQNLNKPGHADYVYNETDFKEYNSLSGFIWDRLFGIIKWDDTEQIPSYAAYLVDGREEDAGTVESIPVDAIASIEVLRSEVYTSIYRGYTVSGSDGLIFIITSKPVREAMSRTATQTGRIEFNPDGVHINKSYYKPTYETTSDRSKFSDLRRTIHWEPSLVINTSGETAFDFFTADEAGTYLIVVEGLDLNGGIARKIKSFEVR